MSRGGGYTRRMRSQLHDVPAVALLLFACVAFGCGDKNDDTASSATGSSGDGSGDGSGEGSGEGTGDSGSDSGSGSGGDDTGICGEGYDLTWDNWGCSFFATYCDSCHAASSPNRFGAPEHATFDTLEEVEAWSTVIYLMVLEDETMPLGGGVYEEDLYLLDVFLTCSL